VAGKALNGVFQRIRALAAVHTGRECGDRELLERFLQADDEAAFTLLVERHGPMVLGLCRRVLRDKHEADDACQATFLVLARKARSVRKQESLASWLHGVAYRVALSLRRQQVRRLRRELAASRPAAQEPAPEFNWDEFRAVLDEELQRLPERSRAPLVLCYLEGKTRDEAAQQLGLKPGALHGLLNRGRILLRDRLTRRGLSLSSVLFATALTESTVRSALAPPLVVASSRAALALVRGEAFGEGLVGPQVLSLVKEASQAMFMTKLKIGAALVVAASIVTGIVGGSLQSVSHAQDTAASQPKAPASASPAKTESDEEFIRRMSKDLRGVEPTATEIHFFAANKDGNRRQKLIDLFIQERQVKEQQAKEQAEAKKKSGRFAVRMVENLPYNQWVTYRTVPTRQLNVLQSEFLKSLNAAANEKQEVAAITRKYLEQLQEYVKAHPKNDDVPDAMQQINLIYRSQGKTVEADAWRDKLLKEHPKSPAAKGLQQSSSAPQPQLWMQGFLDAGTMNAPSNTLLLQDWQQGLQPYLYQEHPLTLQLFRGAGQEFRIEAAPGGYSWPRTIPGPTPVQPAPKKEEKKDPKQ